MNEDNCWTYEPESTDADRKIAKKTSPDLNLLNPIRVDSNTTLYVSTEKLDKYGKQYFIDKLKSKRK